jgi:flagellar motility protein MotE (MotC chaperone)
MSQACRLSPARLLVMLTCVLWAACAQGAPAETKKDATAPRAQAKKEEAAPVAKPAAASTAVAPDIQQYCANVAATAGAARVAKQERQLLELQQQVEKRVVELDAKRGELQALIDKYDGLVRKADDTIVGVYTRMKPDAAAAQIANLDEDSAAALLLQLKPKNASAILGEMDAARAALVTKKMSSLSSLGRAGKLQ